LADCRARLNARVDPGALNAGQAWILGYRADDGFGGIYIGWKLLPFLRRIEMGNLAE
jgi:hypothetical protein